MEWLTETKIPIGKTAKYGFEWLRDNAEWFFVIYTIINHLPVTRLKNVQ